MSDRSFRFLHASDFRLDAVPRGLTEVPDHLRDTLLDAPYNAARRVFDTALAERVAFVILAGNILQPDLAGPRGTAFLSEQFQRLAEAGIGVYWAGGQSDPPEAWPAAFPLPENVRVFAKDRVTDFLHQYDGSPLARIVGTSRGSRALYPAEFSPDAVGLFSIGVACGEADAAALLAKSDRLEAKSDRLETYPTKADGLEAHPTKGDGLEADPTKDRQVGSPSYEGHALLGAGGTGRAKHVVQLAGDRALSRHAAGPQPGRVGCPRLHAGQRR